MRGKVRAKKGSIFDIPFIMVFMFGLAFVFVIWHIVGRELFDGLNAVGALDTNTSREVINSSYGALNGLDYVYVIILIGLIIFMIVSTSMIDTHPVFFVVALILLAIFTVVSFGLGNAFESLSQSPDLANETGTFQITFYIVQNYPVFLLAVGFITLVIMYSKFRTGG